MFKLNSREKIQLFFRELFQVLKSIKKNWNTPWIEIPTISFFNNLNVHEINEFIHYFNFLKKEAFNCISINKIEFIIESMAILNYDIKVYSEIIDYHGFELLIKKILCRNGYYVINNFYFSDNSPLKAQNGQKRYEIDIVGLKKDILLIIDAKQWFKRSPSQAISNAANLQYQRGLALIQNPEILNELLSKLLNSFKHKKKKPVKRYGLLKLVPLMVTLEENFMKLNENHVPLVCINRLNSFLNELGITLDKFHYLIFNNFSPKPINY